MEGKTEWKAKQNGADLSGNTGKRHSHVGVNPRFVLSWIATFVGLTGLSQNHSGTTVCLRQEDEMNYDLTNA